MSCPDCPCPGRECPRVYCDWAALRPPDEVKLRHIRVKMGCGETPALALAVAAPEPRPSGLRRELVVCRYREDLDWLDDVPGDVFVSILDKSDEPYRVRRQSRRERLTNIGREAHSLLHHVVLYYDALADWTYTAQGDALHHAPDFIGRLGVEYGGLCPLTRMYSPDHPPEAIKRHDRVEDVGGFEVRYGDAVAPVAGRGWFNPRAWEHVFARPMPAPLWFGYSAQYAVPRRCFLARPRAFWAWLLRESERSPWQRDEHTDPPLTPWQIEALWCYLLGDPDRYPHRPECELLSVSESLGLVARMKACAYRDAAGCGCSGARCALRAAAAVSHADCFDCLRTYD